MAFYYNDQRLDTHDGEHGIIISRVAHDTSAAASVSTAQLPRADGVLVSEQSLREKRIRVEGTVVGTSKADFEARLDTLKSLLSARAGQLRITNYGTHATHLATFETGEAWTGDGAWDTTNVNSGTRARALTVSLAGSAATSWAPSINVSTYATSTLTLSVFVPDASLVASITVGLVTTAGTITRTWTSFTSGWNELTSPVAVNMGTITSVEISAAGTGATVDLAFDALRLVTTADDRTYDVRVSGDIQIPREHFNVTWCRFAVEFLCPLGTGRSSHWSKVTLPSTLRSQQFLPLDLDGSGTQSLQLHMPFGTMTPAAVCIADHYVDTFGGYDSSDVATQYEVGPGDTWSIAAKGAYLTALTSGGISGGSVSIRGDSVRNGSITALLWRPTDGTVGLFARAEQSAAPLAGANARAAYASPDEPFGPITISTPTIVMEDDVLLNIGERVDLGEFAQYFGEWIWLRLTVRGRNATAEYRAVTSDTWTTASSGPTRDASGAWGLYASGTTAYCAHLELVDFDADARGTLSVAIPPERAYPVRVDTAALAATTKGIVSGTFPRIRSGMQRGSVYIPASAIGSPRFYEAPDVAAHWMSIGGASQFKGAFLFNSGANTFIRRRGTFIYLARSYNATTSGDLKATIQTVSVLDPTGTFASPSAVAWIVEGAVPGRVSTDPAAVLYDLDFNSTVQPFELVWVADIPVTPNTDYAVVVELDPAGARPTVWNTPLDLGDSSGARMRQYDGAWANPADGNYGFLVLQGDNPVGDTAWSVTAAHEPTYL